MVLKKYAYLLCESGQMNNFLSKDLRCVEEEQNQLVLSKVIVQKLEISFKNDENRKDKIWKKLKNKI